MLKMWEMTCTLNRQENVGNKGDAHYTVVTVISVFGEWLIMIHVLFVFAVNFMDVFGVPFSSECPSCSLSVIGTVV